jgi:hypothetical protein
LTVALYGYETWSPTLEEEHRLRVSYNRMLRKIFGARRDDGAGDWRRLHNEELHDLYSSPDIAWVIKSKKNEMGGACGTYGANERCIRGFGGNHKCRKIFRRATRTWEANI